MCVYIYVHIHIYIYMYIYTFIYKYIYTCIYILPNNPSLLMDSAPRWISKNLSRGTWSKSRCGMGWLRLVGSLKLQVSFAEYRLFCRALLQKRPIIWRSLLIEATPYAQCTTEFLLKNTWSLKNFQNVFTAAMPRYPRPCGHAGFLTSPTISAI